MGIECGFFNSIDGDRTYTAEDMNMPYQLLVSNGVFATPQGTASDYLQCVTSSGLTVKVKAGRGIFANKWFLLDSDMSLTLDTADVTLNRIDTIAVKIDATESVRGASIVIKKGTPATKPNAPTMTRSSLITEYRLADIYVGKSATAITQASITDQRGSSDCGWITSLVQQVDTSTLYIQWQTAFDEWFNSVKETLKSVIPVVSYHSYTKTNTSMTSVPINISQYNKNTDILEVFVNGLKLVEIVDYTIASNSTITLTKAVDSGTSIEFVVFNSTAN